MMFACAGTHAIEPDRVIHNVDMSWNKAWEGTQQVRSIEIDGRTLTYQSAPAKNPLDGKDCIHTVKFEKVGRQDEKNQPTSPMSHSLQF